MVSCLGCESSPSAKIHFTADVDSQEQGEERITRGQGDLSQVLESVHR